MHLKTHYSGVFTVARVKSRCAESRRPCRGARPSPRQPHKHRHGEWGRVAAHPEGSRKPPSFFNYKFPYLFNGERKHFLIDLRGSNDVFTFTANKKTRPSLHGVGRVCTPPPWLLRFQLQSQDKLPIGATYK